MRMPKKNEHRDVFILQDNQTALKTGNTPHTIPSATMYLQTKRML
jgi:hypothetical protein